MSKLVQENYRGCFFDQLQRKTHDYCRDVLRPKIMVSLVKD